jgi:hypothetical protein
MEVQKRECTEANLRIEANLQAELQEWLLRDEMVWKQKSREIWLKEGDRNSKFFHLSTIIRRRRNSIDAVRNHLGSWITEKKEINEFFLENFKQVFTEEEVDFPVDLENLIQPSISIEENTELCTIPTPLEIKRTLFEMASQKAPGPDGLPVIFYKTYWKTVGNSFIRAVTSFFEIGKMHKEINKSLIVLILKVQNPTSFNHFRPISLCNVVYKTITKLIVSKLRPLLHKIISPTQSAFIPRRWIAENQVIVHEVLHSFKKRKLKRGMMATKLDLQKAYDRVNWRFLKVVLLKFGFDEKFFGWVVECVSSMSFELPINGGITGHFKPSRGLRQGDPLSPYLFILNQEVLSRLLEREHLNGKLSGVKTNIGGPAITHTMYADDIMLFSKATSREAMVLNDCVEKYCTWSGQQINRQKSGLVFSKSTQQSTCRRMKHLMQMKCLSKDTRYLGAPLFFSHSNTKDFKYLQDKVEAKLIGWRSKCLSWAGRCTLIKAVAQSIPTYAMSTFEIPTTICNKLDASARRFWWNPKKSNGKYLAWRSWEYLCRPKGAGGLGFRKSKDFNTALIAKLAWMVASKRESLCMAMLRSKYKVRADWMRRNPIKGASPIWRAIEKSKKVIEKGACFLVGDGCAINVWMDPWIPWIEGFKPRPRDPLNPKDPMSVSTLINSSTREWKLEMLLDLFDMETVATIQKIRLPFFSRPDKLVWIKDRKGQFSAKSAYNMCQESSSSQSQDPLWKNLWKLKVHERVKMLLWRIASNVLPTKDNLDQRLGVSDTNCPLCNEAKETIIHLFFECSVVKAIWFGSCWSIRVDTLQAANCTDIVKLVLEPPNSSSDKELKELSSLQFAHTLEAIWNLRNKVVHGEGKINLIATIKSLEKKVLEFKRICETSESMMQSNYQTHWTPPPPGFVKINVDAAVANSRTTLAVVARNEHGNIVKAWAKEHMAGDALFVEASAFLWALQLAKNSGMQQIIVEGDAIYIPNPKAPPIAFL